MYDFLFDLLNSHSSAIYHNITDASTVSTRVLDLCFNRIRKVEGLENLTNLKKLYLVQNKLHIIENLGHLTDLRMLELGSNRIRVRLLFKNSATQKCEAQCSLV